MTPVIILIAAYLVVALAMARMVFRAPEGYEDETGFHTGSRPSPHASSVARNHLKL